MKETDKTSALLKHSGTYRPIRSCNFGRVDRYKLSKARVSQAHGQLDRHVEKLADEQ